MTHGYMTQHVLDVSKTVLISIFGDGKKVDQ